MTTAHASQAGQEDQTGGPGGPPVDWRGLAAAIGVTLIGALPLVARGTSVGIDTLDFFYPMFAFQGTQLRSGFLPAWNPYQFAGTPFAADPESGWTYLPAMLFFTVLPLAAAAKGLMLFHFVLAAASMYALARAIGITVIGAYVAAVAFALSYFFYTRSICCPAHLFVMVWIPSILIGVWLATRAECWATRIWWWGVAGLALSQVLAGWLGQGSGYAIVFTASFIVVAEAVWPAGSRRPRSRDVGRAALALIAVFTWAGGFAVAGILPRLEYVRLSNLAEGYRGHAATQGGLSLGDALTYPLLFGGVSVIALAFAAPFLGRGRFMVPYFATTALVALLFSLRYTTPLHAAAYALLPRVAELHRHSSERVLLIFYPAVALLAGAAVAAVSARLRLAFSLAVIVSVNLLVINWGFPLSASRHLDLDAYFKPSGAATFLQDQDAAIPARFFGYDPQSITVRDGQQVRYIWQMFDPQVTALLVNNRATLLRLEDIQGYNPLQLQRYVEFFDRMNGEEQEYHGRYVLPGGLASPLLDLLNARYIVIPAEFSPDRADLNELVASHPVVYRDAQVQVLENREAFPRAWLVHEARQVSPGEALDLLASGAVDARRVALLEVAPPIITPATDPGRDQVTIEARAPGRMRLRARSDSPSLLVLSEIAYPAWQATVDGAAVPLIVADHTLQAVPLPAGEHLVELRFVSVALRAGLAMSLGTVALFLTLSMGLALRRWRGRSVAAEQGRRG